MQLDSGVRPHQEAAGRFGDEHPVGLGQAPDAGTEVHRGPVVVPVAQISLAGVDPDPHPYRFRGTPFLRFDGLDDRCRRGHGTRSPPEDGKAAVPFTAGADQGSRVGLDGCLHQLVVEDHRLAHLARRLLPQLGGADHIGHDERDRSVGELPRHGGLGPGAPASAHPAERSEDPDSRHGVGWDGPRELSAAGPVPQSGDVQQKDITAQHSGLLLEQSTCALKRRRQERRIDIATALSKLDDTAKPRWVQPNEPMDPCTRSRRICPPPVKSPVA